MLLWAASSFSSEAAASWRSASDSILRDAPARLLRMRGSQSTPIPQATLRRRRRRSTRHDPVPALFDQHARIGGSAARVREVIQRAGLRKRGHRRPSLSSFTVGAGHRGRAHAAFRAVAALARPRAVGRRERRRGAAPRGARGARRRCRHRGLRRRRHQPCRFASADAVDLLALRAGRGLSVRLGRRQCELRADHAQLHEALRRQARGLRQDLRRPARQRTVVSARHDEEDAHARRVYVGAADRRSDPSVRLRDAMRRRGGVPGLPRGCRQVRSDLPRVRILSTIERHNAFPDDPIQVRGGWALDVDELCAMAGADAGRCRFRRDLRRLSGHHHDAARGSRLLRARARGRISSARTRSPTTARSRTTPPAGSSRSGRPARPAAFSAWSKPCASSPAQPLGTQVPDANACLVSGFGMINYDRGLSSCAAILARAA